MLRHVIKHAGLIDNIGQMFGMTRRKAVVLVGLNVQKLVKWISVGQPRGALLITTKQITIGGESQRDRKSDARAHRFPSAKIGRNLLNRAAVAFQVVTRFAIGPDPVAVYVIASADAEIH